MSFCELSFYLLEMWLAGQKRPSAGEAGEGRGTGHTDSFPGSQAGRVVSCPLPTSPSGRRKVLGGPQAQVYIPSHCSEAACLGQIILPFLSLGFLSYEVGMNPLVTGRVR